MTNKLGDMLKELRDPNLPGSRLDEIVRIVNEFYDKGEKVHAWTRFVDGNPTFEAVRAGRGNFSISPVNGYSFVNNQNQSIADSTYQMLTFNNYTENSPIIQPTSVNGKFKFASNHSLYGVVGAVQWASNAAGIRELWVYVYDNTDALLYSQELHRLAPSGTNTDILPFANVAWIQPYKNLTYFRFMAYQNSGGALNVTYVRIGVFAFY